MVLASLAWTIFCPAREFRDPCSPLLTTPTISKHRHQS